MGSPLPPSSMAHMEHPDSQSRAMLSKMNIGFAPAWDAGIPAAPPPVKPAPNQTSFAFDYQMEKDVVKRAEDGMPIDTQALASRAMEEERKLMAPLLRRYPDVCTEHSLAFAFAAFGPASGSNKTPENTYVEFCRNFAKMKELGFEDQRITGALKVNANDLQRACNQLYD